MTLPSVAALKLAGFLMAHALWVMSELRANELYVPQALCESKDGNRELFVFEAGDQLEAINRGKEFLSNQASQFERCAFARDGQANPGTGYVDVLIIDIVEGGLPPKLTIVQPYSAAYKGNFQLLGKELLLMETGELSLTQIDPVIKSIRDGAGEHSGAKQVWTNLSLNRNVTNPLR